jgi:hypothetical protein
MGRAKTKVSRVRVSGSPDRCGKGEDALWDADGDSGDGASARSLIDSMTCRNGLKSGPGRSFGLTRAGRAEQSHGALVWRASNSGPK